MSGIEERPNKYPLPPLLTVGVIVACYALDQLLPIGWEVENVSNFMRGTGVLLLVASVAVDAWAFKTFRRHSANMMPHKAASQLLMDGPFAHSRNPIYAANVAMTVGFGFLLGSRWFLIGAVVLFVLLSELAVKREERHMEAKFGDRWKDYCKAVRRWV